MTQPTPAVKDNFGTFTLALRSSADIEGHPCIDVFTLKKDGEELCDIHFAWCDEEMNASCKIVALKAGFTAADLPYVNQPFMLVGIIQSVLDKALCESEHEFYSCLFLSDDADVDYIELPIDFADYRNR